MPKLTQTDTTADREMLKLACPDWHLFPISTTGKGKAPRLKQDWANPTPEGKWWKTDLLGAACGGPFDVIDFDIDKEGGTGVVTDPFKTEPWASYIEQYEPVIATTPSGGYHLYVQGGGLKQWGNRTGLRGGIDFRTAGGYVVIPSSAEPQRNWVRPPWNGRPGPVAPLLAHIAELIPAVAHRKGIRSQISELAFEIQQGTSGTRNDRLAALAGHLVKRFPEQEAFEAMLRLANAAMPIPLPDDELENTVFKLHGRVGGAPDKLTAGTQFVKIEDGNMVLYFEPKPGAPRVWLTWIRGTIEPLGLEVDPEGTLTWSVRLNGGPSAELPGSHLGDQRALLRWLAARGIHLDPWGPRADVGAILADWFAAHEVGVSFSSPHWGWHEDEWIGLGKTKGPSAYKIKLGRVEPEVAQGVMRQMATWQSPVQAAVFCSWVAAQAVKGRIPVSFEPNLVVRGRAGSGKTKGLFGFGARLTGSPHQASATVPVIRDALARHRNGIVVLDDIDNTGGRIEELYRQSAQSDSVTKKTGPGFTDEVDAPLLGSFMITGEAMGQFDQDAALIHRTIELEIEHMQGRQSLLGPHEQWVDITRTFEALGAHDESAAYAMSGTFVELCLDAAEGVRAPSNSRTTAKFELIRMGALVFDRAAGGEVLLYNGERLLDAVERWILEQTTRPGWQQTTLVQRILPAVWHAHSQTMNYQKVLVDTKGEVVWRIHAEGIARWWAEEHRNDKRAIDLGSGANIRNEIKFICQELDAPYSKTSTQLGSDKRVRACWALPASVIQEVLQSTGITTQNPQVSAGVNDALAKLREQGML